MDAGAAPRPFRCGRRRHFFLLLAKKKDTADVVGTYDALFFAVSPEARGTRDVIGLLFLLALLAQFLELVLGGHGVSFASSSRIPTRKPITYVTVQM